MRLWPRLPRRARSQALMKLVLNRRRGRGPAYHSDGPIGRVKRSDPPRGDESHVAQPILRAMCFQIRQKDQTSLNINTINLISNVFIVASFQLRQEKVKKQSFWFFLGILMAYLSAIKFAFLLGEVMFNLLYQKDILGNWWCYIISLATLSLALTACTGFEIEDHSYTFNEATESTGNRLLLLNAVRASKNYPMQFSRISSYTGQGRVTADFSPSFPFGVDANHAYDLKPTVKVNSGVQKLDLVDLNTEEAQERLRKKLDYNAIK